MSTRTFGRGGLITLAALALAPTPGAAQWERVSHQTYLPAAHNWEFRRQFPAADRLFNAFDFGHGILYEVLYSEPDAPVERLEDDIYERLTRRILTNPPKLPMPEAAFMPNYARLAPRAKEMFDWAHTLHRQVYDVLADDRVMDKEAAVDELVDYYLSRRDLAFPDVPKGMEIMDEQYYSKVFRERYPRYNGLIWAYHWLQLAVHEPLLPYRDPEQRRAALTATLARFWQMLEDPPAGLPAEMPMAPAIAPEFTRRFPRAAAIFDNLHMMHDVISDILVSEQVPDKRAAIYQAARQFNDPQHLAVSREAWVSMALAHGVARQGGPAVGLVGTRPAGVPAEVHHGHDGHEGHDAPGGAGAGGAVVPGADSAGARQGMELLLRLLADPQVEARIHASPELHGVWSDPALQRYLEMVRSTRGGGSPAQHHDHSAAAAGRAAPHKH